MKIEEQPYDDRHREPVYVDPDIRAAPRTRDDELTFFWPSGLTSVRLGRASVGDLRSIDTVDLMMLQAHLEGALSVVRRAIEARR